MNAPIPHITLYSKPDCHLCDIAKQRIARVRERTAFHLETIDISTDPRLYESYRERIPVVLINGEEAFAYRVSEKHLLRKLRALRPPWWKRFTGSDSP